MLTLLLLLAGCLNRVLLLSDGLANGGETNAPGRPRHQREPPRLGGGQHHHAGRGRRLQRSRTPKGLGTPLRESRDPGTIPGKGLQGARGRV